MKKHISKTFTIIIAVMLALFAFPVSAQQSDHAWILVDVVDYDNAEKWRVSNESPYYQSDYSCSQGTMSVKTNYIGETEDWKVPPRKQGEGVRVTASFSSPAQKLYPGEEVKITLSMSASDNTLSYFAFGGSANADFDNPETMTGFRGPSSIQFTNADSKSSFAVDAKNNYSTINETLTAIAPAGKADGEQLALRQNFYMGNSMSTYYIYEWRSADSETTKEEEPEQSTPPTEENSTNDNTVPFQGDPDMKKSGVEISDLYGEVLIELYDDNGNFVDAYSPELGEELAVNAVIITKGDSGVQLSLRDMTTFVIKSNSKVRVGDQTEDKNKLSILAGHVWGNVKQVIKDGSMDMEMSQAVAGIKGTTFILEDDGKTSTVKVFEGVVEVTPLNGGNPVLVEGGNMVSVTQAQFGNVQSFDMDKELATWNEDVQKITKEAVGEDGSTLSSGAIIAIVLAALLAIVGIGAYAMRRIRRK